MNRVDKLFKEKGMTRSAVIVASAMLKMQFKRIAKETGITIGGELYSDSMGEEGSAGETYIGMMRENVILIVNALK